MFPLLGQKVCAPAHIAGAGVAGVPLPESVRQRTDRARHCAYLGFKGKADAKVDRVAADSNKEAATKQADASREASTDKRDADYKVAIEKCDALAGPAKDGCVSNAKVQFGKS
jgi:hypothetical protein